MQDILGALREWLAQGVPAALATVTDVVKSAPRQPGAAMAVNGRGEVVGSVSGGCVEGALYEEATRLLAEGGSRLVTYGIADDDAFAVGLTCGGTIHLYGERMDWAPDLLPALSAAVDAGAPAALVAITAGPRAGARLLVTPDQVLGSAGAAALDAILAAEARAMLAMGRTGLRQLGAGGEQRGTEVTAFIQSFAPLAAGADPADLERIASPIGLDIGGRTPEETAVSIAAEMIALRHGRTGGRLSRRDGSIHARPTAR